MRDIVARCLVKDPSKRPTAAQLLEHKFFKTAHEPGYLAKHLLSGLPPVTERVRLMRSGHAPAGRADNLAQAAQSQVQIISYNANGGSAGVPMTDPGKSYQ